MRINLYDPDFLIQHRCGLQGLYHCLSLRGTKSEDLVAWSMTDDVLILNWDCTDKEAFEWLLSELCPIKDGVIAPINYSSDVETRANFLAALSVSLHQLNTTRTLTARASRTIQLEEYLPPQILSFSGVASSQLSGLAFSNGKTYHKQAFTPEGEFKKQIPIKGPTFPGAEEIFLGVSKAQQLLESPEGYVALSFLPVGCGYQRIKRSPLGAKKALKESKKKSNTEVVVVFPEVLHLRIAPLKTLRTKQYDLASTLPESALNFALQENLLDHGLEYVELFSFGKEGNQKVKRNVQQVDLTQADLDFYTIAKDCLPGSFKVIENPKKDQSSFFSIPNRVLGLIATNLVKHVPWYSGYRELAKGKAVYYRKQIGTMLENIALTEREQLLTNAVKGAQSRFVAQQIEKESNFKELNQEAKNKFFERCLNKSRYKLLRPTTQKAFSKALVQFLSQYNVNFGDVTRLYPWLYSKDWAKAQDLALLALVSRSSSSTDSDAPEVEEIID